MANQRKRLVNKAELALRLDRVQRAQKYFWDSLMALERAYRPALDLDSTNDFNDLTVDQFETAITNPDLGVVA